MVILLSVGKMNVNLILENKIYLNILATKVGIGIIPKLICYENMCMHVHVVGCTLSFPHSFLQEHLNSGRECYFLKKEKKNKYSNHE